MMNACAIALLCAISAWEALAHRLHVRSLLNPTSFVRHFPTNCESCSQRRSTRIHSMSAQEVVPVLGASKTDTWMWRGYRIRFARSGKPSAAPPVVFVHGFGASADSWRMQYKPLSEDREVFGLDLLGFGRSEKALVDYSAELWADQVRDFIEEHITRGQPVVLGGNSIGSLIAITVAASADMQRPVAGLIFCNAAAGINSRFLPTNQRVPLALRIVSKPVVALLDTFLKIDVTSRYLFENLRSQKTIAKILSESVYADESRVDDALVASIAEPAEDERAREVFVRILTSDPGTPPDALMPKIDESIPILMCWGDVDQITPKDVIYGTYFTQELRAQRPGTTSLAVVRAGHCPQDDDPDSVNAAIIEWLRKLGD